MTKFLGLADVVAASMFAASFYQISLPRGLMMVFGIYLILKGLIFITNFFSLADVAGGVFLVFNLTSTMPPLALLVIAAFLSLKGIASLFS